MNWMGRVITSKNEMIKVYNHFMDPSIANKIQ
jgi:hypothetical protein